MVIYSMLQSMDNGRQNYRSLKLASALTILSLIQCIALTPYTFFENQRTLLELTVPGLGIPINAALNATSPDQAERVYVIGSNGW